MWPSGIAPGNTSPFPLKGATELPQMTELLVYVGNHERGRTIFEQTTCVECHQVNGKGINFGPDLSEIGGKLSKQGLYESILDPSATVSPAFRAVNIVKQNGKAFSGFITSETKEELTLQQVGGVTSTHKKRHSKPDNEPAVPHADRAATVDDI